MRYFTMNYPGILLSLWAATCFAAELAAQGVPSTNFKSRLTQVNGLLITPLPSGKQAGAVTRISLTALSVPGQSQSEIKFNQSVGDDMQKALHEVNKFSQLRHNGWPGGHAIEIGFAEKYVPKDGPSAAVACALLLEAAITGKAWDPAFAVTGDMNADGSVQPIGGVQAKIRGATKGACKIVAVPVKNEKSVADVLVLEGPMPLVAITVFGISTFEDALLLADLERPQTLKFALTDFDNMRNVMMSDPRRITDLLKTPHAVQRMQALLTAAPNCYSAKYLLMHVQGRGPRALSLGGSIDAAQERAAALIQAVDRDINTTLTTLKGDELGDNIFHLRKVRPILDNRVWPYVDRLMDYGEEVRKLIKNPPRGDKLLYEMISKAKMAGTAADQAFKKLMSDPIVIEELGD
ncbi:MAG: S16 family serine protease [Prosthecobacter sp.]|nr:S16 family serine protease [Prosthecobacter sp.]